MIITQCQYYYTYAGTCDLYQFGSNPDAWTANSWSGGYAGVPGTCES